MSIPDLAGAKLCRLRKSLRSQREDQRPAAGELRDQLVGDYMRMLDALSVAGVLTDVEGWERERRELQRLGPR